MGAHRSPPHVRKRWVQRGLLRDPRNCNKDCFVVANPITLAVAAPRGFGHSEIMDNMTRGAPVYPERSVRNNRAPRQDRQEPGALA